MKCPLLLLLVLGVCACERAPFAVHTVPPPPMDTLEQPRELRERMAMVAQQIAARGVTNAAVLAAMRAVPRHLFVPASYRADAYADQPLPIGLGQTISQPYIVAAMTEALEIGPGARVLEIGTGSGYQAAVLAALGAQVYSIEIIPELAERAATTLRQLCYTNVQVRCGDGYQGWPEAAPFDGIIVTCAPEQVPRPLQEQLAEGGRLVIPVGARYVQTLVRLRKHGTRLDREDLMDVLFVPMTGKAQD
jgi:protein-L-isoaspartate(D-aspartate) O-methyltransferase